MDNQKRALFGSLTHNYKTTANVEGLDPYLNRVEMYAQHAASLNAPRDANKNAREHLSHYSQLSREERFSLVGISRLVIADTYFEALKDLKSQDDIKADFVRALQDDLSAYKNSINAFSGILEKPEAAQALKTMKNHAQEYLQFHRKQQDANPTNPISEITVSA